MIFGHIQDIYRYCTSLSDPVWRAAFAAIASLTELSSIGITRLQGDDF